MINKLNELFHLEEHGTTVKTEVLAGITTFMTMAYILAVNPNILSAAGMDKGAVFTATALAALIGTLMMAIFSNYPFALAPGMGLNAYFAYTVVLKLGYSWQMALAAVFIEGILFIILSLTNVREAIFNAIPKDMKNAVSVGIGLFIALIGFVNAGVVINDDATLISMFTWSGVDFATSGITVILALLGILITALLVVRGTTGGILWGILITWGLGIVCQLAGFYVPNVETGFYSLLPDFSAGLSIPSIAPTLMQVDFSNIFSFDFLVVIFAFLFVDLFDTLGTLMGVSSKADMLDADGKLPHIKGALLADAVATSAGALLGTSTTTTFVESASGVAVGGRTGLTSVVTAIFMGLALFLSPLFLAIPSFATAPALIIVGFFMLQNVTKIDFQNALTAIPCFLCIVVMPFCYSIAEGIGIGIISYSFLHLLTGKGKDVHPIMYVVSILFICKYIWL